jgi:patatin-like phospholipase/acyl hydrolase
VSFLEQSLIFYNKENIRGEIFLAKYRILSFDGGGILATTSITLLNRLANESAEVLQNT